MDQDFSIPAGGIVKKILINNVQMQGKQEGTTNTAVNCWYWYYLMRIIGGPNNNRIVYESARSIPMVVSTISTTVIEFYTGWYNAGEKELGVNEKMSYGKSSDTLPWKINFSIKNVGIASQNTTFPISKSFYTIQAKVLYYL